MPTQPETKALLRLLKSWDAFLLAPHLRLVDALSDPRRRTRTALLAALVYAALWAIYVIMARSSADMISDMAEEVVWSRNPALGYSKHPPILAWFVGGWFTFFPLADWAFNLLAALVLGIALFLAFVLAGEWLDGPKRAAAPFLLALIPFYNFLGLKLDQNAAQIPLWAFAIFAFVRSLKTGSIGWAVLAGVGAASLMLVKYWCASLVLAMVITALLDARREAYLRSAAPYVSALVAGLLFLPHFIWLVQSNFLPMRWVSTRRLADSVGPWFRSLADYLFGTIGYASVVLVSYGVLARPSRAALRDTLLPSDNDRRRACLLFWLPLLIPIPVAAIGGIGLLSLWNIAALVLLPVVLLSSPLVHWSREAAARVAALVMIISIGVLPVAPFVAYRALRATAENDGTYARLAMEETQRRWSAATDRPLRLIAGPFGLVTTAAFYGADRPSTFPNFDPLSAPWLDNARIAREGIAVVCPADLPWCMQYLKVMTAAAPGSTTSEVELRRRWLGFESVPGRYVIAILPPQ